MPIQPVANLPSVAVLRDLFFYDADLGWLRLNKSRGNRKRGARIGNTTRTGYRHVRFSGNKAVAEHRIIWAVVHGAWPELTIDHINGNRSDNRLANLRLATMHQQGGNRSLQKNNVSGFRGVSKKRNAFRAKIYVRRKCIHLGLFPTAEEASAAHTAALHKYFGEFASTRATGHLPQVRAGLAAGEGREAMAAEVSELAVRCGRVLDGGAQE